MIGPQKTRTRGAPARAASSRKRLVLMLYAVWVAAVLLACTGYLAESATRKAMDDGSYEYNPSFGEDGEVKHYVVQRGDPDQPADIEIRFIPSTKTVTVEATNIYTLEVDCRDIARDKHRELLGTDFQSDELWQSYFYELEYLRVNARTDRDMTITWKYMPIPLLVTEDGEEVDFQSSGDTILVDVPQGNHNVMLYFTKTDDFPTADFSIDHPTALVKYPVQFDSSDSEGDIDRRVWDFGDGSDPETGNDVKVSHAFTSEGTYTVTLEVRTSDGLKDTTTRDVDVRRSGKDLDLDSDGIPDWDDDDQDGDGTPNVDDDFPRDPGEVVDTDGDNIGDNADTDDDGDGVPDEKDEDPLDPTVGEKAASDEGPDMTMYIILALVLVVVLAIVLMVVRSRAAKKREDEPPLISTPPAGPPPPGADLGFSRPGATPPPSPPAPVMAEMEEYEEMEVVEVADEGEAVPAYVPEVEGEAPIRGGPYDTAGMGKEEYLDSLDTILRDEFSFPDEQVDEIIRAMEEELKQEV